MIILMLLVLNATFVGNEESSEVYPIRGERERSEQSQISSFYMVAKSKDDVEYDDEEVDNILDAVYSAIMVVVIFVVCYDADDNNRNDVR